VEREGKNSHRIIAKKERDPAHPAPVPRNEKVYDLLIVILLIGIVVTSLAVWFFRFHLNHEPYFSEVHFDDPDGLPSWVRQGENNSYEFSIKSFENQTRNLSYLTRIDLYNMYDETEEKYSCISRYREKIYMRWTNESDIRILPEQSDPGFSRMYALPAAALNWSRYTMDLGFPPPTGTGRLVTYFSNGSEVKYFFIIDQKSKVVTFNNISKPYDIDLARGNNKLRIITSDGNISVKVNDVLLFHEEVTELAQGSFGLESADAYYTIDRIKLYQDTPVVVPDRSTVLDYSVSMSEIMQRIQDMRDMRTRSIEMERTFQTDWNESIDCENEPFYCEYFDLENDISFYLPEKNLTRVVEKVPVEDISYRMSPWDMENSSISWEEYQITFLHDRIPEGSTGAVIFKMGNLWALMLTRNNSYFMRPSGDGTMIDEIRNPPKEDAMFDLVNISVGKNITLQLNGEFVFSRESPEEYTDGVPELYIKNAFIFTEPLHVLDLDPECQDKLMLRYCELVLESTVRRRVTSSAQTEEFRIEYVQNSGQSAPLIEEGEDPVKPKETFTFPIYNPFIPDQRIVFNTLIIENETSFGLDYNYQGLDGARIFEIGLLDENGTDIVSMYALEHQDRVITYYGAEGRSEQHFALTNITQPHNLGISVAGGNVTFSFDHKRIRRITGTGIDGGEFYIGSRNSHVDFGNIGFHRGNISRSFSINQDPCELRLVHRSEDRKQLSLSPGEEAKVTESFTIAHDFDYGKVSVRLFGSGNMPDNESLEIHFWVMRDD